EGAVCEKTDYSSNVKTYVVPGHPSADEAWVLAILKAGADASTDGMTNDLFWEPVPGETFDHNSGKDISHVIICSAVTESETPTTPPTTATTPPTTPATTPATTP